MSHFAAKIKECCAYPPAGLLTFEKSGVNAPVWVNLLAMQRDGL
jgi:hypothetical protein